MRTITRNEPSTNKLHSIDTHKRHNSHVQFSFVNDSNNASKLQQIEFNGNDYTPNYTNLALKT